jgi:hypothetical protein
MRAELQDIKKFELLNDEKITPYFLGLAKSTKVEASLEGISDENGTVFEHSRDRVEYIRKSFENLYKEPNVNPIGINGIENFLGDVNNNIILQQAKLTNIERETLEQPLTIEEFDNCHSKSKNEKCPGADGFSNKFIKKFWNIFRVPLFRLAAFCYENNRLTDNFRSANIKLIPKKGDLSQLKNWRPISLLNCFYKIISRVLSNRLKVYMDKLTPCSQKGYSSTRRCQEVLIDIIEGINECKAKNKKGALLSLDIKKAFDTIGHSFIERVLDFFNFGPL